MPEQQHKRKRRRRSSSVTTATEKYYRRMFRIILVGLFALAALACIGIFLANKLNLID